MTRRYDLYGIGHALVDMEFTLSDGELAATGLDKGRMTLADLDLQEKVLAQLAASPKRSSGGSAANTVLGAAQFGCATFFSCRVGDDETGRFFARDLLEAGVANRLAQHPHAGVTGRCLVLVTPDAERTLCTHLGASERFAPEDLDPEELAQSQWLYIEGYLVTSPSCRAAAVAAHREAKKHGVKVALTCSDVNMVTYFRDGLEEMLGEEGVDLLFCNESEALAFAGESGLSRALPSLRSRARTVCITRGGDGALLFDGQTLFAIPGAPVLPVDSNGAGDLFAGAFLYGITRGGLSFEQAGGLACRAASQLVTQFGARLRPGQAREILDRS